MAQVQGLTSRLQLGPFSQLSWLVVLAQPRSQDLGEGEAAPEVN